jgi:chitin synthase
VVKLTIGEGGRSSFASQGVAIVLSMFIFAQFIIGLGHKPKHGLDNFYLICMHFFGSSLISIMALNAYGLYLLVSDAIETGDWGNGADDPAGKASTTSTTLFSGVPCAIGVIEAIIFVVGCIGLLYIVGLMHGEVHHLVFNTVKYFYILPTYIFVFGIFAWCNVHDLSWGTKGAEKEVHGTGDDEGGGSLEDIKKAKELAEQRKEEAEKKRQQTKANFKASRTRLLLWWVGTNVTYMWGVGWFFDPSCFLIFLAAIVTFWNSVRFLGSMLFLLGRANRGVTKVGVSIASDHRLPIMLTPLSIPPPSPLYLQGARFHICRRRR